jgi:hypothetical protein
VSGAKASKNAQIHLEPNQFDAILVVALVVDSPFEFMSKHSAAEGLRLHLPSSNGGASGIWTHRTVGSFRRKWVWSARRDTSPRISWVRDARLIPEPWRNLDLAKACCAALELAMNQCQALVDKRGSIEHSGVGLQYNILCGRKLECLIEGIQRGIQRRYRPP